jgi:cytochrome c
MTSIAGKENLPAGQVFKNVQEMKDVPAGRFLVQMDSVFGRALSLNCNSCHLVTDWASDSLARKKTARTMMNVVNAINTTELAKLNRPRTPQITCVTCHRGSGNTAPGQIVP